ncbi:hypothetical protein Hanom_Chr02g00124891 [Helianthus anomalus]
MEGDNSVAVMVNNPEDATDGDSVCNNGEDHNMADENLVDDVEEGEIRSPAAAALSPEKKGETSNEQPLVVEKSCEVVGLHGKHGARPCPWESNNINEGNVEKAAEINEFSNVVEERVSQFCNNNNNLDGPTPSVGLGKKNRDTRSPPSSGSMQGPPARTFFQDPPTDPSLDLNRPSKSSDSRFQENMGDFLEDNPTNPGSQSCARSCR